MEAETVPFWLIATPIGMQGEAGEWNKLAKKCGDEDLSTNFKFAVPMKDLKVGTLDSLMALSDDLVRADAFGEATAFKIYKQLMELQKDTGAVEDPTIPVGDTNRAVSIEDYLTGFSWDEAKYPVKTPLKELCELLNSALSRMDEELKAKSSEFGQAKGAKQAIDRKETGNLLVRSLNDIVKASDFIESEHLTTLLVVVPKFQLKEWASTYATLGGEPSYVVPGSSKTVYQDTDTSLCTVTLFRSCAETFKHNCREKRFIVRDFTFSADAIAEDVASKEKAVTEHDKVKGMFVRWCKTNFAEAYSAMVHLKAVRLFVESVLRYGVPPAFQSVLLKAKPRKDMALRKALDGLYGHLAAGDMVAGEEMDMPGQQAEFYPYVYLTAYTSPPTM